MIIFDVVLLILLAGFVFYGLFFGLIRTFGSVVGVIAGVILAGVFYQKVFGWLDKIFPGHDMIGRVITYIVLFLLIQRLVSFGFMLLDKAFDFISIIPFLKTINRLAGAVFGLLLGGLILGFVFYAVKDYPIISDMLKPTISKSKVAPPLISFIDTIKPIMPGVFNSLKSIL